MPLVVAEVDILTTTNSPPGAEIVAVVVLIILILDALRNHPVLLI